MKKISFKLKTYIYQKSKHVKQRLCWTKKDAVVLSFSEQKTK